MDSTANPRSSGARGVEAQPDTRDYRNLNRTERRSRLDDLTRQAEDDGLNDMDKDAYRDALIAARKS